MCHNTASNQFQLGSIFCQCVDVSVAVCTEDNTLTPNRHTSKQVKVKVEYLYSAPSRHCHLRGAHVHGAHRAASHIPALCLPSRSRYSFTDPERMEGWVSPGPGCKEQLTHDCYATTAGQRDSNSWPRGRWSSMLTTRLSCHLSSPSSPVWQYKSLY